MTSKVIQSHTVQLFRVRAKVRCCLLEGVAQSKHRQRRGRVVSKKMYHHWKLQLDYDDSRPSSECTVRVLFSNSTNPMEPTTTMPTTNKRMTLSDARTELERRGFSVIVEESNKQTSSVNSNPSSSSAAVAAVELLVGVQSRWRWDLMARVDVMVFVHQVNDGDALTLERLEADLEELPSRVQDHFVGGFPPHGFSRATMILAVYLTDQHIIDPAVLTRLTAHPKKEWCTTTFLAAQDGQGRSYFMEGDTPMWGKALFPELRYWAGLMTGRPTPSDHPPSMPFIKYINTFSMTYCLILCFTMPKVMVPVFALLGIVMGAAATIQWYRDSRRRSARYQHAPTTEFHLL